MQKWILGKSLASNEDSSLFTYGITSGCPIFLYLFNSEELYAYQHQYDHYHHFLTDSLPSLVELNEEQAQNEEEQSEKQDTSLNLRTTKLDKKLSTSLDINLNKNRTLDRRFGKKQLKSKQPTNLVDVMLDCKFDEDQLTESELLPPPIDFQSDARLDFIDEPLLIEISNEPIHWIDNKLHHPNDSLIYKSRKPNRSDRQAEDEQYESASEDLIESYSIEEDRSIEEILIEEEVYELEEHNRPTTSSKDNQQLFKSTNESYKDLIRLDDVDLVTNREEFECSICLNEIKSEEGVILRECLHSFCK